MSSMSCSNSIPSSAPAHPRAACAAWKNRDMRRSSVSGSSSTTLRIRSRSPTGIAEKIRCGGKRRVQAGVTPSPVCRLGCHRLGVLPLRAAACIRISSFYICSPVAVLSLSLSRAGAVVGGLEGLTGVSVLELAFWNWNVPFWRGLTRRPPTDGIPEVADASLFSAVANQRTSPG
jgi:hypothetical protein